MTINKTDNIKAWDARLKDQSIKHWDNYSHIRIDLTNARLDEEFVVPGDYLYVEDVSDEDLSVAKIKFNKNNNDELDLEDGVEIYTVFTKFYITNDALEDEWIDIVCGINFIYKKKIAGDGFVNPIVTAAGVDLVLLPGAGGITQIGDAGATSHGLVNNDDLFVSGELEVDGIAWFDQNAYFYAVAQFFAQATHFGDILFNVGFGGGLGLLIGGEAELITIPVGQGAAGVVSVANLAPANSTIVAVVCRVTQAPGGGATTLDIGRTGGGNLDEFIDGIATALGTTGTFSANHDAATTGPVFNVPADTLTLTTDANVLVTDMIVRVGIFWRQEIPPTS